MKKKLFNTVVAALGAVFFLSGCSVEHHYYHQNHHHSPEYENRHQSSPRVDLDIHN